MKAIVLMMFSAFAFAPTTGFASQDRDANSETRQDARKVGQDQRYINRQKRQMGRAAENGNLRKAGRKYRNAQAGKAQRAKDLHEVGKDVQEHK